MRQVFGVRLSGFGQQPVRFATRTVTGRQL